MVKRTECTQQPNYRKLPRSSIPSRRQSSAMRFFLVPLLVTSSYGQFIAPEWRGLEQTEFAAWEVFTKAKFQRNSPDVHDDDASILCTTSSAFITSGGNIYSFQGPTFFQLDDSASFPISSVTLQIYALGSSIDFEEVRIVSNGENYVPTTSTIVNQDALDGEFGGLGTNYAFQWDLTSLPIPANTPYFILFNATESSLSLDQVQLDTSASFQPLPIPTQAPPSLTIEKSTNSITVSWSGTWTLESSSDLTGPWDAVTEFTSNPDGSHQFAESAGSESRFFRLTQPTATE